MMKVLYHSVLFLIFNNLYCYCGTEVSNFISSFNQHEKVTEPWNWTLEIPRLNIHISVKNPGDKGFGVGIFLRNNITYYDNVDLDPRNSTWVSVGNFDAVCSWDNVTLNISANLQTLDASYNMSVINLNETSASTPNTLGYRTIILQGCDKTMEGTIKEIEVETSSAVASYNETGRCICKENNATLYNDRKKFDGEARCNAVTEWSGCQKAECWFAPTITSISQGSNYSEEPANFVCSHVDGFPTKTDPIVFFISNQQVPRNKTLKPSDHNKTYRCEANNDYTRDINESAVSSREYLVVFFSPEIAKPTEPEKFIGLYNSTVVSFDFQANPVSDNITATFSMPNGTTTNETIEKNSRDVNYKISYYITINSSKDYGYYNFTVGTIYPEDCDFASINIVDQPVTTTASLLTTTTTNLDTTSPKSDTLYIAIGCSGAVVLIIVLVVFLIIYRKRKGKSASDEDIKEERENPLYGSAPGPSPNAEYATVDKSKKKQEKEEKVNPIYQGTSAGADADTVEEAYAAIDIKKKKKKKEKNSEGSENSAFDPEATYAAVNKPKKKKNVEPPPDVVYSAVQKKKKNDQPSDTDLHV